jgi:hypothetical protein
MLKNRLFSRRILATAVLLFPVVMLAQEPPTPPTTPPAGGRNGGPPAGLPARPAATGPKKYEDVITAKAKTKDGLFKVHTLDEKWYYEIPEKLYGRDMLMYNEIAQAPPGVGYSGSPGNTRMVRWERRGNRIFLKINPVSKRATDGDKGTQLAVALSSFQPIIRAFNIEAEGKDKSAVIDVTSMFSADIPELEFWCATAAADQPECAAASDDPWQPAQLERDGALQHGAAAGEANDGSELRPARGLLCAAV